MTFVKVTEVKTRYHSHKGPQIYGGRELYLNTDNIKWFLDDTYQSVLTGSTETDDPALRLPCVVIILRDNDQINVVETIDQVLAQLK